LRQHFTASIVSVSSRRRHQLQTLRAKHSSAFDLCSCPAQEVIVCCHTRQHGQLEAASAGLRATALSTTARSPQQQAI
jgi:hypothetical protein